MQLLSPDLWKGEILPGQSESKCQKLSSSRSETMRMRSLGEFWNRRVTCGAKQEECLGFGECRAWHRLRVIPDSQGFALEPRNACGRSGQ